MTTSEFIKLLQEADPDGTAHVRMEGGIPRFAELKEGYWDGPFSYINENGEYVYSIKGLKVDIHCIDIESFVEDKYYHRKTTWEDIEKLFKFELDGYCVKEQRDERERSILKQAKDWFDENFEMHEKLYQKQLTEAKEKAEQGYRWFQNKEVDTTEGPNKHIYYTWIFLEPDGKIDKHSNIWKVEPVLKSGLWQRIDNDAQKGYFEWVYKPR